MQVLPLLGSAILIMGASYLAWDAIQPPITASTPLVQDFDGADQTDPVAENQRIDLVPKPRNEAYFAAITQRPLFVATRRPVANEAPVEQPPEPSLAPTEAVTPPVPNLRLVGVMTGGAQNAALLSRNGGAPEWERTGANLGGWTLTEIAPDHVILEHDTDTHRVELYQR